MCGGGGAGLHAGFAAGAQGGGGGCKELRKGSWHVNCSYYMLYSGYTVGIQWVYSGYTVGIQCMGIQWVYSGYCHWVKFVVFVVGNLREPCTE